GVKLEGYPEHPMNRGYLNVFRRCSGSRTIHKHWPAVRSSLNQEFVLFCEREVKMPGSRPQVDCYKHVRDEMVVMQALAQMAKEFKREWPLEGSLCEFLEPPEMAWIIRNGSEGDGAGVGTVAYPCGLIALRFPEVDAKPWYELFMWMRG